MAKTMRDVLEGIGEHLADRVRDMPGEVGQKLKDMTVLGAYELGAAIWQNSAYRGDLGLLSYKQPPGVEGHGVHGPAETPGQDGPGRGVFGAEPGQGGPEPPGGYDLSATRPRSMRQVLEQDAQQNQSQGQGADRAQEQGLDQSQDLHRGRGR